MKVLLDTHALLWYATGDSQLSSLARNTIRDATNTIYMSPASYWEIAIKIRLGKYVLSQPYEDFIATCLTQYGFRILPIEPKHTALICTLPFPPNHKDPFDRLIVAQAIVENLPIISCDTKLDHYSISRLW